MEVKPGYKQTEVGVIPEDWEIQKLDVIAEIIMGQSPRGSSYNKKQQGLPLINGPTEFTNKTPIKIQWTTEPTKTCKKDDLLICVRGSSTGRMNISNDEYCIGRGVSAIRSNSNSNTKYITYQLESAIRDLLSLTTGSTFPNLNSDTIRSLKIPVPRVKEQTAIATALSDVDALISGLDRLIEKKRAIKQAAMQELLTGKRRLPGFKGSWNYKKLGDISVSYSGGTPNTNKIEYFGGKIPWVSISDMTRCGKFISQTERTLSVQGFDNCAAKLFPPFTILYAMYASIGECSISEVELCSSQAILGIIPNKSINCEYLYYYLVFKKNDILEMRQQGTQKNLNAMLVRSIDIPISSLPEQTAIATVLSDMDAEISALETRRAKTISLKQGMMQELLTGRVRLV